MAFSFVQLSNALASTEPTPSRIFTEKRFEQPLNDSHPNALTEPGMVISERLVQFLKAKLSIVLTLSGISICFREELKRSLSLVDAQLLQHRTSCSGMGQGLSSDRTILAQIQMPQRYCPQLQTAWAWRSIVRQNHCLVP